MKKLLLSALFLGCIISISFAQKNKVFTIEGTVVSKETGVPIPFAQIVLIEINQWGFTNEKGHFKIGGVFKGNYTLQSSALGYVYYKIPVTIANNVASLKIQMLPDNLTINKVDIALLGQKAEHWVGINCGIMDQFSSVHGQENKVIKLDCKTLEFEYHDANFSD
ncbi:MAG: carboxypeptidase-like regulatory domain-containing protein, partial [Bacteroidales bacterium]